MNTSPKKKILFAYDYILHYRISLFNILGKKYDFTVIHAGKSVLTENDDFKEIIYPANKIGPFMLQKGLLNELRKEDYDIILFNFDLRWVNSMRAIIHNNSKAKIILWGAWLTDSNIANYLRVLLMKKSFANIFYTEKSRNDFVNLGIPKSKTYVANNTIDVGERVKSYENGLKFRILFVGSLNSRKQNFILLDSFYNIINSIPKNIVLTFIGEGNEKPDLEELVKKYNISDRISFKGAINNPEILKDYYKESIVSVSFGQAGLAVLQSFGFGVPFLTKINAVSGGEKYNIIHGENGLFCQDNMKSLQSSLTKLCNDIEYCKKLGKNAYNYYTDYCTIENMAQGFIDSIENTQLSKIDLRK